MVGSHKILTVSYGTFSCTLEGFEDSFETMKAIAEYFRDLAADDRYFGAEPPVPDAEMLARIAEREIARRVEARMEASGVVLRVGESRSDATANPAAAATAPVEPLKTLQHLADAPRMPPLPVAPPAPAGRIPESVRAESPAPMKSARPDNDSVASKLQRIRAVVGKSGPSDMHDFAEDATEVPRAIPSADQTNGTVAAIMAEVRGEVVVQTSAEWSETAEDLNSTTEPGDKILPAGKTETAEESKAPFTGESDAPVADVIVASTEEESDYVAQSEEIADDLEEAAAVTLPEPVAEMPAPHSPIRARVIKMRRADLERAVSGGILVEEYGVFNAPPFAAAEAQFEDDMDLPEIEEMGGLEAEVDVAAPSDLALPDGLDATEEAQIVDLEALDAITPAYARVELSPDDEAELLAELDAVEREADLSISASIDIDEEIDADDFPPTDSRAEDTSKASELVLASLMARVAQPDADDHDLAKDTVADEAAVLAVTESAECEDQNAFLADVMNAATEVEMEPENLFESEPEEATDKLPHAHLRAEPESDEAAISRIVAETDAQLSEPDARMRREAIAQLKAAVAATEAARLLGEAPDETEGGSVENAFRDDLRQVVRPRRPQAQVAEVKSERPRPAPLKLVASQRIDLPEEPLASRLAQTASQPIRPRRVVVEPEALAAIPQPVSTSPSRAGATSFADFAEEMDASSLADLLEAAAAYTSFVEGSEDFSRPQLLQKVSQMAPEQFSREDGLRSFGTLLREGRIMRSGSGRFVVNEETRFNPVRDAG
jgi:hypothetical protein